MPGKKVKVAVISADVMGKGDDELGKVLIKGFLYALSQMETHVDTILFYNGGAKLTTEGSDSIEDLKKMEAEGLECVEIKQHSSVLHQPTKWLKELILQQAFRYEENRLLEINFQNARCTEDTNLNKYVNKKKSTGKVDEVVALINAMYLLQQYLLNGDNFVAQTA